MAQKAHQIAPNEALAPSSNPNLGKKAEVKQAKKEGTSSKGSTGCQCAAYHDLFKRSCDSVELEFCYAHRYILTSSE